jgi:hypothetical protein
MTRSVTVSLLSALQCQTVSIDNDMWEAWWNSRAVSEARERSGYEQGRASMADLMAEVLVVVDEHEAESTALPDYPKSTEFSLAAYDFAGVPRPEGSPKGKVHVNAAITQLLDIGADPERVKACGAFDEAEVDRVVDKWATWRETAVTMMRQGKTADEIRVAVPSNVAWRLVKKCLSQHGFEIDTPADRRSKNSGVSERVVAMHESGIPPREIAVRLDLNRTRVYNILRFNTLKQQASVA